MYLVEEHEICPDDPLTAFRYLLKREEKYLRHVPYINSSKTRMVFQAGLTIVLLQKRSISRSSWFHFFSSDTHSNPLDCSLGS